MTNPSEKEDDDEDLVAPCSPSLLAFVVVESLGKIIQPSLGRDHHQRETKSKDAVANTTHTLLKANIQKNRTCRGVVSGVVRQTMWPTQSRQEE